jgi:S1-C subfamily serine protease
VWAEKEPLRLDFVEPVEGEVAPGLASHAPLLAKATPSIVSVFPAMVLDEGDPDAALDRFFLPPDAGGGKGGGGPTERSTGSGSGVIVSDDGFIVTNRHVIILPNGKAADSIRIELSDKRQVSAELVGMDTMTDLALLKVEADGLVALPLGDSEAVLTGDLVFAIGNPFRIGITATMGMVSATRRSTSESAETVEHYIQTDAAINPGNSGGALINAAGQLIGINTAIFGNTTNAGIGFAIPTRLMKHVVEKLAEHGSVPRGFFGIQVGNPMPSDVVPEPGALVLEVLEQSPAGEADVEVGDRITGVGEMLIRDRQDLRLALSMIAPGEETEFRLVRDGVHRLTKVTPWEPQNTDGRTNFFIEDLLPGVTFAVVERGLVIHEITAEAGKATRLEEGMIVTAVNNIATVQMSDLSSNLRKGVNKVTVLVGEATRTLSVRIP